MITHDLGVVANVAEEVVVLYRGRVMESGTLEDIFRNPAHPYLRALLRAVPRFDLKPGERLTPLREIKHDTGHLLAAKEHWPQGAVDAAGPLLKASGLTKRFRIRKGNFFGSGGDGLVTAVDDVSFELRLQVAHKLENLGLDGDVKRRGRLIGDQQRGATDQRHGDHRPLAQAAR